MNLPPASDHVENSLPEFSRKQNAGSESGHQVPFGAAVAFWLKLGFISFGGPAGQIAIMHNELVDRRRWISERRFLHALNYCMVLPGPEAQQLATYVGWLFHGVRGGLIAGGLFVLPSLFMLMGLSAIYVAFGQVPAIAAVLDGIKPAVVAIVIGAVIRMGRRSIRNGLTLCFAVLAFVGLAVFQLPFPAIVLGAGLLGWLGSRLWPTMFAGSGGHSSASVEDTGKSPALIDDHHEPPAHARVSWLRFVLQLLTAMLLWAAPLTLFAVWQGWNGTPAQMSWFFTTAAFVTFGGAYAVLPFVAQQAVDVFGWLKPGQMIDGLALGETTPGPLIMVVAFVGFVGGWQAMDLGWSGAILGCLIATWFTFLPSFLFILLGAPFIEQMREELHLNAALSGITAAVVGVILNLAIFFGRTVFFPQLKSGVGAASVSWRETLSGADVFAMLVTAGAFFALTRYRISLGWVVVICGLLGVARYLAG